MSKYVFICLLYAIVNLIGGYKPLWETNEKIFFVCMHIGTILLLAYAYMKSIRKEQIIISGLFILTVFELIDELAGANYQYFVNDYVLFTIILFWTLYRLKKCQTLKQNS